MNVTPRAFVPAPANAIPVWLHAPTEIVQRLLDTLQNYQFTGSLRGRMVLGLASVVLEQQHAIVLLLRTRLNSAALALARAVTESLLKTQWMQSYATDEQVERLSEGVQEFPDLTRLIADVMAGDAVEGAWWAQWKLDNYRIVCDYAHTGRIQVSYWFNGNMVEPTHPVDELQTLAAHSTMLALLAAVCIADAASDASLLARVNEHLDWFKDRLVWAS
ncbi:DUF6988 family protein [Xylophilus ampelinus]|uniref:AbiV family abortive infection protein n=1 Tax=Xylophilus ampelinus TaxID=54067 RepID=A0A318SVB2_9BURK|nr:hypothetical protein [Xylophilus ampelinus]MCS4511509.1 hypothetical protein [Xylophilus ampelinus]PYE74369.1 hypothetical protein DFQ15_12542 [Xylophilus ampelinus]